MTFLQEAGSFQQQAKFLEEAKGNNWMSFIDGKKSIADLSIPGTHDSGAIWGEFDNKNLKIWIKNLLINPAAIVPFSLSGLDETIDKQLDKIPPQINAGKDQDKTIREQLDMGVRFLDIRLRCVNDQLYVYHGPLPQGQTAESVFDTVREWLEENPKETVLIHLQKNADLPFGESIIKFLNTANSKTFDFLQAISFLPAFSALPKPELIRLNQTYAADPLIIGPLMKFEPPFYHNGLQTIELIDNKKDGKKVILNGNIGKYEESLKNFVNGYMDTYKDLIYTDSKIPSLDEVRGEIVLLDFGGVLEKGINIANTEHMDSFDEATQIEGTATKTSGIGSEFLNYYKLYVQNKYKITPKMIEDKKSEKITSAQDYKFDLFKRHYEDVRNGNAPNTLSYNFLSAYNTKYDLVEHKVDWVDDSLNYFTTDFGPEFYSDELNPKLLDLLPKDEGVSQLGNIIVDFITPELAQAIYKTNDPDFYPQTSPLLIDLSREQEISLSQNNDESKKVDVCVGCIPGLEDSGHFTTAQETVYVGAINSNQNLDPLLFEIIADEPVDWDLFGPSSSLLKMDSRTDNNISTLYLDFIENSNASERDDYPGDTSTTGFLEINRDDISQIYGWLDGVQSNMPKDGNIEFTVRAIDRYENVSDTKIILETFASATPISDISKPDNLFDDTDWFKTYLNKGDHIKFTVGPGLCFIDLECSFGSPVIDALYDSDGNKINDYQLYEENTSAIFSPDQDNFYYISVGKTNPNTDFGYSLTAEIVDNVEELDPESLADLNRLDDYTSNNNTSGYLDASNNYFSYGQIQFPEDSDWFQLKLSKGQKVNISINDLDGEMHPQVGVNAIFDRQGNLVQDNENPTNSIKFEAPQSGSYFIEAFSRDPITSAYSISADPSAPADIVDEVIWVDTYDEFDSNQNQIEDVNFLLIKKPSKFKKKFSTRISDFSDNDILALDGWSHIQQNEISFRSVARKKTLKKIANKKDIDFIYHSKKGRLYYNENGDESGFGDGGIIAIIKKSPDLIQEQLIVF